MKRIKWRAIVLTFWTICLVAFTQFTFAATKPSQLTGIKLTASKNQSNVTFTLVGSTPYHLVTLTEPHRIILDLEHAKLATELPLSPVKVILLKRIHHITDKKKNALRIILDMTTAVNVKSYINNSLDKTELLLEITPKQEAPASQTSKLLKKSAPQKDKQLEKEKAEALQKKAELENQALNKREPEKSESQTVSERKFWRKKGRRSVIVVIDPGHGGKDPGARGPHNSSEKHVVLAISKELQRQLNAYPGIHAVLTRKGDYFLDLRQRLRLARKYKAELFIAIHADAAFNNSAHGASVFALSERGASSEAARWLAEKENYSELGQVSLDDKNYQLRSVLLDLSQTATINQSLQVGQVILRNLTQVCTLHCNRVEQARFVVLKSPDIPSLLVETGFISNPQEEWRLHNPRYQRQLAQAMAQGIKEFFWHNPPPGSVFYAGA